jgi:5-methylcytosine-specific restriction endonuclease McrA
MASVGKECPQCGKSFTVKPSHAEKRVYCSRACLSSAFKVRLVGESNPHYKGLGTKVCKFCGEEFDCYSLTTQYCSRACRELNSKKYQKSLLPRHRKSRNYQGPTIPSPRKARPKLESEERIEATNTVVRPRKVAIANLGSNETTHASKPPASIAKTKQSLPPKQPEPNPEIGFVRVSLSPPKSPKVSHCSACGVVHYRSSKYCLLCSPRGKKSYKVCPICGNKFKKYRVTCSRECASKWQAERQLGERSHRWKGGLTSVEMRKRMSLQVSEWRKGVFQRDDFTCSMCGQRGGKLAAHHVKQWQHYPDLRLDINNGITLCWPCHASIRHKEELYEERFSALVAQRQPPPPIFKRTKTGQSQFMFQE